MIYKVIESNISENLNIFFSSLYAFYFLFEQLKFDFRERKLRLVINMINGLWNIIDITVTNYNIIII